MGMYLLKPLRSAFGIFSDSIVFYNPVLLNADLGPIH